MTNKQKLKFLLSDIWANKSYYIGRNLITIAISILLFTLRSKLLSKEIGFNPAGLDIGLIIALILAYIITDISLKSIDTLKDTSTLFKSTKESVVHELELEFHNLLTNGDKSKFRVRLYEEFKQGKQKIVRVTCNTGKKKEATTQFNVDKGSLDRCEGVVGKTWRRAHFPKDINTITVSRNEEVNLDLIKVKKKLKKVMDDYNMSEDQIKARLNNKPNDEYLFPRRMVGFGHKYDKDKVFVFMLDISSNHKSTKLPEIKDINKLMLRYARIMVSILDN